MDGEAITTKSDLEHILLDESMEAKAKRLSLSLLKCITNSFSDEHQIGRGGFAVVYKGRLEYAEVAVKKLTQNCIDENKFIGEVHCLMKAKHKNIVRFLGYCSDTQGEMVEYNGKYVMADVRQRLLCFEYVPNGSLDEYIKDASREWGKCYKIIKGVCEGLHYLHKERIVRLDLKPANILLGNNMVPKITDFGISRCFGELQTHVFTSKLTGSLGYLAPEFFSGKITFNLDIYSLGVIITEILTGDRAYPEVDKVQEDWRHKLEESQKELQLEQIRVCTEVAQSCLEYKPEKRPSAQTIIETLRRTEREERCIELEPTLLGVLGTDCCKSYAVADGVTPLTSTVAATNMSKKELRQQLLPFSPEPTPDTETMARTMEMLKQAQQQQQRPPPPRTRQVNPAPVFHSQLRATTLGAGSITKSGAVPAAQPQPAPAPEAATTNGLEDMNEKVRAFRSLLGVRRSGPGSITESGAVPASRPKPFLLVPPQTTVSRTWMDDPDSP